MYRFCHSFKRFSTGTEKKETFLEHLKSNETGYSVLIGIIVAGLGGLNFVVGLQMKHLQVEIQSLEKNTEVEFRGIKEELKDLKTHIKDSEQRQELLTPLLVQVGMNKEKLNDLNKEL
jgi:hypothetical protein